MIEKLWAALSPVSLTAAGDTRGKVTVSSTRGFRVKMAVTIQDGPNRLALEVKRVTSATTMFLGPMGTNIKDRTDLSAFPSGSIVYSIEQPRQSIPLQEIERAVYEEEPVVALRTIGVDEFGNPYNADNPLPVRLNDVNIVVDNLSVQLSHLDNWPNLGDVADSVRIGDGVPGEFLGINPDGSINVNIVSSPSPSIPGLTVYQGSSSVAAASETTILTVVAPLGGTRVARAKVSGENVALVKIKLNGNIIETDRMYWCDFNSVFEWPNNGLKLLAGDVLTVTVYHTRPMAGTFDATVYTG